MAPVESFSTPRRLTARVAEIAERQEDLDETVTGPPVSAAFEADGAADAGGAWLREEAGRRVRGARRGSDGEGRYLAYHKRQRGKSAVDALPELLAGLLRDLSFPKQMHWDASSTTAGASWSSAGRSAGCCFSMAAASCRSPSAARPTRPGPQVQDVESGALTYGHRFLATSGRAGRSIKVRSFDEYQARLAEHFVILEHAERRDRIARELEAQARRLGGRACT